MSKKKRGFQQICVYKIIIRKFNLYKSKDENHLILTI